MIEPPLGVGSYLRTSRGWARVVALPTRDGDPIDVIAEAPPDDRGIEGAGRIGPDIPRMPCIGFTRAGDPPPT